MSFYKCKIIDSTNKKQNIIKEANDMMSLIAEFKRDNIYLVRYKKIKEKKHSTFFALSSKVKRIEVINFLRQFSVMVKASIPISDAINSLRKLKYTAQFKKVLHQVYYDIESGNLLSDAFSKHPKIFPVFFINMVAIGEVSGSLDKVLSNMADYYENDRKIKRKVKSSMFYPLFLLGLTFGVIIFINVFVLPKFDQTINELGGQLPKITKVVMSISKFITNYIFIIIPSLIIIIGLFIVFLKTNKGKNVKETILYYLPIISKVQKNLITSRFSKAFIILLESGMNIIDCLENLKKMLGNKVFSERFESTIDEVRKGKRIASAIEETSLFPTMLTEMINIGEQSGNIEEVLKSSSEYFDECVESSISKAVLTLEPIMIIFLGLVVVVVILAVLLPIISLMNSVG